MITPEQRVINELNRNDDIIGCETGIRTSDYPQVARDIIEALNTETEDEPVHGELDGYVSPDCGCKYCVYGRKQIAKQLWAEFEMDGDNPQYFPNWLAGDK